MTVNVVANEMVNGQLMPMKQESTESTESTETKAETGNKTEETKADAETKTEETKADAETKTEEIKADAEAKAKPDGKAEKVEKRFGELTKAREDAKRDAQRERARAEAAEARIAALEAVAAAGTAKPAPKTEAPGKPKPDEYADAFEYAEALSDWKVETALAAREEAAERKARESKHGVTVETFQGRMEAAKIEIEDFDDVVNTSNLSVSDVVRDAIVESELGPQLIYHLAKHPDEVKAINAATPVSAVRMLGKLEAKLVKEAEKEAEPEPEAKKEKAKPEVKTTKAPPPISPIKGGAVSDGNLMDSNGNFTGSFAQYKELRRSGKLK